MSWKQTNKHRNKTNQIQVFRICCASSPSPRLQSAPKTVRSGEGGAGGAVAPKNFQSIFFFFFNTQILYFQIVLSVNQKIMQLQVKLVNHGHIAHYYVERHSIPSYTAKTFKQIFQSYIPRSLVGGRRLPSARPARLILYFWRLLALHNPTWCAFMLFSPPLLLQVLCCTLFTGVANWGTRGGGHAPCWSKS